MKRLLSILLLLIPFCGYGQFVVSIDYNCNTPAAITGTTTVNVLSTTTLSDATNNGTWSSSNTAIGSVTSGGVVTGVSAGTCTISYTICPGWYATTTVTVSSSTPAVTWNPSDAGSNITLSNGNLTATNSGAGFVRATKSIASGRKVAWEIYINTVGGSSNPTIGVDDGSGNEASYIGSDSHGWGYYYPFSEVYHSASPTTMSTGATTADVLTYAVDNSTGTPVMAIYKNGVAVTPTFTLTASTLYYPAAGGAAGGTPQCTARFLSSSFTETTLWTTLQAAGYTQL